MTAELRQINRQLAELRSFIEVNDIINRQQAIEIMGVNAKTFTNYVFAGKVLVVSTNAAGQKFFSRKQILGLK